MIVLTITHYTTFIDYTQKVYNFALYSEITIVSRGITIEEVYRYWHQE